MNSIKRFFSSLLPSFERSRISEDIDLLRKELNDNLLPAFQTAAKTTAGKGFKSELVAKFNALFVQALPQYRRDGFIVGTLQFFSSLPAKLDVLDSMVLEMFAKDVTKDTITYRKAAVIQYLEAVRFATQYATRSLLRFLPAEAAANLGGQYNETLSPAEIKWLNDNQFNYLQTLKLLSQHPKDLQALLDEIPDIAVVPEKYEMIRQTVGSDKLDPLKLNVIAPEFNPIYHFRMMYAEWQVKKYESQIEEKRLVELQLLALKEAYGGKRDAQLAQRIEYSEGRLQRLNVAIARMQEHAA